MAYFREITEHYRIDRPLSARAEGGVFRAFDAVTGAPVALKLISMAGVPPEGAQAFVRAMGALQALRHPTLPILFDFGFTPNGYAFLVLEQVDGRGAEALIGGAPAQILPLLSEVLDGLERMAEAELAHHNLCPENLLVVPGPAPGRIRMAGLGSALLRPPGGRPEGEAEGFAAPELTHPEAAAVSGAPGAADLFSLALVACRLFEARLSGSDPRSPQVVLPLGVTFELEDDQILQRELSRALRFRPDERPTCEELRRAFHRALAGAAGPRPLPPSKIFLSPEPEGLPWVAPDPGSEPAPSHADADPGDDTNPVFHSAPAPAAPEPPAIPAALESAAPPPVAPAPAPAPATLAPLANTARPARRRLPAWVIAAAAVLLLGLPLLLWLRGRATAPAAVPTLPAGSARPAARLPPPPATRPTAQPPPAAPALEPPLPAALAAARDAWADGKDEEARRALAALTRGDEAALSPAACTLYRVLGASLAAAARSRQATDFRAALAAGDLPQLANALRALTVGERAALLAEPGLRKDLAAARRAVELYQRYLRAVRGGEPVELLVASGAVAAAVPRFAEAVDRRERTAAGLEGEAETLFQTGAVDAAVERLETLRRGWPERSGLSDRLARYTAEQRADQGVASALTAAAAAGERKRPDEGLAQLQGVKPTPRSAARLRETQRRLAEQLAQLDRNPPAVQLAGSAADLEYEKGQAARIRLRITDDYQVKAVTVRVRPEGGAWTELPCNRAGAAGPECTVEVPESLHQNRTIELYAVATDLSGHQGRLGSAERPQAIRRKHWYDRLRPKG
jgi:eukaryotic-like serine/threonine-protein kinase